MFKYKITVFTPTYNRAHLLERLYRSIQRQTYRDFEWLIVDDGSVDNTPALIAEWIHENNDFPIRYHRQENGGKHRAINRALELAQGELFFTMDSDDYLTDDALEKIASWFENIDPESNIQGIVANRGYSSTETVNYIFEEPYRDQSFLDVYSLRQDGKAVLDGERAIVFFTNFHRKYRFPEFEGERFLSECAVYNRMAHDGYLVRYFNDIIWIFAYREDGLTKAGSSIFLRNPKGYGLILREKAEFLGWSRTEKLKMWYTFTCDLAHLYSAREIAGFIGAPYPIIAGIYAMRKLLGLVRK